MARGLTEAERMAPGILERDLGRGDANLQLGGKTIRGHGTAFRSSGAWGRVDGATSVAELAQGSFLNGGQREGRR